MELAQALAQAVDYERQVRDHYARCSRLTEDPHGQRVFAILAREEQGHLEHLQGLLETWTRTGAVSPGEVPTLLPPAAAIEAAALQAAQLPPASASLPELDFLKQALELERRTCTFYQELVAGLEPRHRPLFDPFLDIEDGHLTLVQAEIDALVGHGHWFDFMEFTLEG